MELKDINMNLFSRDLLSGLAYSGKTLYDYARCLGVSGPTLSLYISKKTRPSRNSFVGICNYLGFDTIRYLR